MANITKLNLKGTEYNLTDLEAQNKIAELSENTYNKAEVDSLIEAIDNKIPAPYDDTTIKSRVTALEAIDHTKYLTEHLDISGKADKATTYTKDEVNALGNQLKAIAESRLPIDSFNEWSETVATKEDVQEAVNGIEVYDDTELKNRVTALEGKTDNDTVYDDSALTARVTALEAKNEYTDADKAKVAATPLFWVGTQAEYDAIATKDNNTFYYVTE